MLLIRLELEDTHCIYGRGRLLSRMQRNHNRNIRHLSRNRNQTPIAFTAFPVIRFQTPIAMALPSTGTQNSNTHRLSGLVLSRNANVHRLSPHHLFAHTITQLIAPQQKIPENLAVLSTDVSGSDDADRIYSIPPPQFLKTHQEEERFQRPSIPTPIPVLLSVL